MEIIVSFLVYAEVARELVAGHGMTKDDVKEVWKDFVKDYKCRHIDKFEFDNIVTGDKDFIAKSKELSIYEKIISYIEFLTISFFSMLALNFKKKFSWRLTKSSHFFTPSLFSFCSMTNTNAYILRPKYK